MEETTNLEAKQASFEGWAIVEMMGHRKEIGFVVTQAFGPAVLCRVDTPGLPEREYVLERPEYIDGRSCPIGTKVQRPAALGKSCLVPPQSLYALNPCTEAAAMALIERSIPRPLIVLELPEHVALPPALDIATEGRNAAIEDHDDGEEY